MAEQERTIKEKLEELIEIMNKSGNTAVRELSYLDRIHGVIKVVKG